MSLRQKLEEDLKAAMRARQELARDTLRMVLAALNSRESELGRDASDEEGLAVLANAAKTRLDSAQQFEAAGRADLAAKERAEVEVVRRYLPRQLSEDETRAALRAVIAEVGASSKKDLGRVMKTLMERHKGGLDGRSAQRLASEMLP